MPLKTSSNFCAFSFQFRYIESRIPSGVDILSARTVAVFGTHATQCHISDLVWRLGPSCLLEDPLGDDAVGVMHKLGPNYRGCFQAPVVSEYYEVGVDLWPPPLPLNIGRFSMIVKLEFLCGFDLLYHDQQLRVSLSI